MSIFTKIRKSCEEFVESSNHVRIRSDLLGTYLQSLPLEDCSELIMDTDNHFCGNDEETVNYFLVLDCINFGSGFFNHLEMAPGKSGYFTVASLLKKAFVELGGFSCHFLKSVDAKRCAEIFKQSPENREIQPLMQMFANALNELGQFVEREFAGSFMDLVRSAENSASSLVEILIRMKYYQDFTLVKGRPVYFLKRAQITVSDLNIAFNGRGPGYFKDIEDLTIFADNLVPHVLWVDGLLEYSPSLTEKIKQNQFIEANSAEELALRASAVHAVELIKNHAISLDKHLTSQQLDYLIWNRGQASRYHLILPHSTRSYFY